MVGCSLYPTGTTLQSSQSLDCPTSSIRSAQKLRSWQEAPSGPLLFDISQWPRKSQEMPGGSSPFARQLQHWKMTIKIEDVYLSSRCAVLTRCIFPVSKHGTALGSTEMMSPESVGTLQDTCFAMGAEPDSCQCNTALLALCWQLVRCDRMHTCSFTTGRKEYNPCS